MTGTELLDRLLLAYKSDFDITRPYDINGDTYEAYAGFNVTSSKYVLTKKAELWRANCFEHVFFRVLGEVTKADIATFKKDIVEYIEPKMICTDGKVPEKDHMYSYITEIFICEDGLSEAAAKEIKKFTYRKNYKFSLRGYSETRMLVFDLKNKKLVGNKPAKPLLKAYKKMI